MLSVFLRKYSHKREGFYIDVLAVLSSLSLCLLLRSALSDLIRGRERHAVFKVRFPLLLIKGLRTHRGAGSHAGCSAYVCVSCEEKQSSQCVRCGIWCISAADACV